MWVTKERTSLRAAVPRMVPMTPQLLALQLEYQRTTAGLSTTTTAGRRISIISEAMPITTTIPCRRQRSEEHTSELQSLTNLVCRLLLEKKNKNKNTENN